MSLKAKPPKVRTNGQTLGKCSRLEPHCRKERRGAKLRISTRHRRDRPSLVVTGYGISREVAGLAATAARTATAAPAMKVTGKERPAVMGRAAESGCRRCASDWSGMSCRTRVEWIVDGSPCKSIRKENVEERPRRGMAGTVGCLVFNPSQAAGRISTPGDPCLNLDLSARWTMYVRRQAGLCWQRYCKSVTSQECSDVYEALVGLLSRYGLR